MTVFAVRENGRTVNTMKDNLVNKSGDLVKDLVNARVKMR